MSISTLLPSMFLRRLALLVALASVALTALGVQMMRLTVVHGAELRESAEARLVRRRWIPTQRGQIKDRKGRILAKDVASFDLAFAYSVIITGLAPHTAEELVRGDIPQVSRSWAEDQALSLARKRNRSAWTDLNDEQRTEIVEWYLFRLRAHVEQMWEVLAIRTGVDRSVIDERRRAIKKMVDGRLERYVNLNAAKRIRELEAKGRVLSESDLQSERRRLSKGGIVEQKQSHVIFPRIGSELGFQFLGLEDRVERFEFRDEARESGHEMVDTFPELNVRYSGERERPYEQMQVSVDLSRLPTPVRGEGLKTITVDGVACHIIGGMSPSFYREHVDQRADLIESDPAFAARVTHAFEGEAVEDLGMYLTGDRSGSSGIEGAHENTLRGTRGRKLQRRDTQQVDQVGNVNGRDVQLTIDIELQARIQAAMSPELGLAVVQEWHGKRDEDVEEKYKAKTGDPLDGAAVVIEIESGEILAMISTPTFKREDLPLDQSDLITTNVRTPTVNRAISKPYPPGSIAKALMLVSAITRGNHQVGQAISCTGHLLPNDPTILRCWIYKMFSSTHDERLGHEPNGAEAIMASCNIFFYTLGRRLGGVGVRDTYRMFGLGRPIDIGLGEGAVYPGPFAFRDEHLKPFTVSDAIQMGIGQGPVSWTPLHSANAYATLARGGHSLDPTLVLSPTEERIPEDLGLDPRALAETLEGLHRSVTDSENGTGHHLSVADGVKEPHFNVMSRGVDIWGKTGTADGAPIRVDTDGDEIRDLTLRDGDHSWFQVLVGDQGESPKYSIAVVMDYAGSGGRVSGPIVNQIVHALCDLEYLGSDSTRDP